MADSAGSLGVFSVGPPVVLGGEGDSSYLVDIRGGAIYAGGLVIGDGRRQQLLVFDSIGRFEVALGGPGAGPDEFRSLAGLQRAGSLVVAHDVQGGRIVIYSGQREPGASVPYRLGNRSMLAVHGATEDLHILVSEMQVAPQSPGVIRRPTHRVRLIDSLGRVDQEFGTMEFRAEIAIRDGRVRTLVEAPFEAGLLLDAGANIVVMVDGDRGTVRVITVDGGRETSRFLAALPRHALTEPVVRKELDRVAPTAPASSANPNGWNPRTWRAAHEAAWQVFGMPDPTPRVTAVIVDDDGGVWLQGYTLPGSPAQAWFLFDRSGCLLDTLRLPASERVLDIAHGGVLTYVLDQDGAPWGRYRTFDRVSASSTP